MAVRRGPGEPLWNGSPGASLPSFAALRKKVAPAGAKYPSSYSRPAAAGKTPVSVIAKPVRTPAVAIRFPSPRRNGRFSERAADSPLACAIRPPCPVASGGLLSRRGESRQRHAKGNLSRRRFPLESFPIGQGAAAPLRSPGIHGRRGDGRRGTRDEGRRTRDE